jgi:proteasome lid subunit RPN8/RPN11
VNCRAEALRDIVAHALEARPAECCGVLIGAGADILEAVRSRNMSATPDRYELDPKVHIDARRAARRRGLSVLGFYHSHPHSAPEPSPTDMAEASYPNDLYLIVGLGHDQVEGAAAVRLFRLMPDGFVNVPFVVVDDR